MIRTGSCEVGPRTEASSLRAHGVIFQVYQIAHLAHSTPSLVFYPGTQQSEKCPRLGTTCKYPRRNDLILICLLPHDCRVDLYSAGGVGEDRLPEL